MSDHHDMPPVLDEGYLGNEFDELTKKAPPRFVDSFNSYPGTLAGWPTLRSAALHGLAGEVVRTLQPHTEADPAGLLATYIAEFGSAVGLGPHMLVEGSRHTARIWPLLVGETSRSRKGTTMRRIDQVLEVADPRWTSERRVGGLGSGEGLIAAVKENEPDGRMLVEEEEFQRILAVCSREGSTLSTLLRQLWDRDRAQVAVRHNPLKVDGAHVTVISHITLEELRRELTTTALANGFANRFAFVCVARNKLLPDGGSLDPAAIVDLGTRTRAKLQEARKVGVLRRTPEAAQLWADLYERMADQAPAGLVGAVTARDAAQCLRMSIAYALMDGTREIGLLHVQAAGALWSYCQDSAAYIFGDSLGDQVADRLLAAIRVAGRDGLDFTAQHAALGRNYSAARLDEARDLLERRRLVNTVKVDTEGRPRMVSYAKEQ